MNYCRFRREGRSTYGLVESLGGEQMITAAFSAAPHCAREAKIEKISPVHLTEAALLAPVEPSKIVCIGRNYREHAAELGNEIPKEPLIFLKPPSSLLDPGGKIILPPSSNRVDHEGELGVVIAKTCHNLKQNENVRPYIRERRDRARPAKERRSVHPRQGIRHVLPRRPDRYR